MTARKHSRREKSQEGVKWFYITAAGLVSAVIFAAILFKIRADSVDSQHPTGTSVSRKITGNGDRAGDSPDEEDRPDKGNQWNKTDVDNTDIRTIISQISLEQEAAQLFIIAPEALTGFQTVTQAEDATYKASQEYPVAGLICLPQNLRSPKQLKTMTARVQELAAELNQLPLFPSIDGEGGKVARIANHEGFDLSKVGTMAEIGEGRDISRAYEASSVIREYLEEFGISLGLAPGADVLTDPDNTAMLDCSFDSDPVLVTQVTKACVKGLEERHVYGTPRHFPGRGATQGGGHKSLAYAYKTWDELEQAELVLFVGLIQDNTPFIMAGHISMPRVTGDDTPPSLSPQILTGYLRETMGYKGIITTDAFNMGVVQDNYPSDQTVIMALQAGADLLLMPADSREVCGGVLNTIKIGELTEERINQFLTRILGVKLTLP